MNWETYRTAFDPDGSLRDVVVLDTTVADWNQVLQVQQHADTISLTISEVEVPIPDDVAWIFDVSPHALTILRATLSEVLLCGYFFTPDEIELDLACDGRRSRPGAQCIGHAGISVSRNGVTAAASAGESMMS